MNSRNVGRRDRARGERVDLRDKLLRIVDSLLEKRQARVADRQSLRRSRTRTRASRFCLPTAKRRGETGGLQAHLSKLLLDLWHEHGEGEYEEDEIEADAKQEQDPAKGEDEHLSAAEGLSAVEAAQRDDGKENGGEYARDDHRDAKQRELVLDLVEDAIRDLLGDLLDLRPCHGLRTNQLIDDALWSTRDKWHGLRVRDRRPPPCAPSVRGEVDVRTVTAVTKASTVV